MSGGPRIVVTDTSVVINFIHAQLLLRLPGLTSMAFVVTDVVRGEVTVDEQRAILDQVLTTDGWSCESITDPAAIEMQADLMSTMDPGEASSLALAATRGWMVACDERRAFLREAEKRLGEGRVLNTPGLLLMAIRAGTLTVGEADAAKAILEANRYTMRFASFADLV